MPVLRQLSAAAAMEVDFVLVFSIVVALFSLARANCFLHLRPADIQDTSVDRVRVVLHRLKGGKQKQVLEPVFGRLPDAPAGSEFESISTPVCCVQMQSFHSFVRRLGPQESSTWCRSAVSSGSYATWSTCANVRRCRNRGQTRGAGFTACTPPALRQCAICCKWASAS